jgi:hypothetical protein
MHPLSSRAHVPQWRSRGLPRGAVQRCWQLLVCRVRRGALLPSTVHGITLGVRTGGVQWPGGRAVLAMPPWISLPKGAHVQTPAVHPWDVRQRGGCGGVQGVQPWEVQ